MLTHSVFVIYSGGGNSKPPQYTCHENLMNCVERQKVLTLKDESPRLEGVQYATGKEQRATTNSSRRNDMAGPKWKQHSVVDVSGGKSPML